MSKPLKTHIDNLRAALLELKATGKQGFEGLIAVALGTITGIPFRLASSGYQRGVDGKAAFDGEVVFEGKLYKSALPRADVLSKIPDFVRHNDHADFVWVLGASCEVSTQLADDLRADGAKGGISVLVLDWMPADFPRLAVALAMGGVKVEAFMKANLKPTVYRNVASALAAIGSDSEFPQYERAIREELDAPNIATVIAEKRNFKWFEERFSNKSLARSELGQPLAPKDMAATVLERNNLVSSLSHYFTGRPSESVICVHGEEGCGKSWSVVQAWLAQAEKPLLAFTTPDDFSDAPTQQGLEERLIATFLAQTGDLESNENVIRWRRRLAAWMNSSQPSRPRFVLVIDGINQRPGRSWGRIIDHAATYANQRGGRVLFTARTHFFNSRVKRALVSKVEEVPVPQWTGAERDEILKRQNVPIISLNHSVAEFLRNPRILAIALEVFGDDVTAFDELSVDRLLFEHIMAGVKEDFGDHPGDFIAHLREQASELLLRVSERVQDDLRIFHAEVPAVAEGRFYRGVPGEPQKYELRDEGLALALGLSMIENLRKAERNGRSVDNALKEILEPIEALDKTAVAVRSAITVCAADDVEFSQAIAGALVKGFTDIQNPPPDSLAALVRFAKSRPFSLAQTAFDLCKAGGHQPNFDWIQAALLEAAKVDSAWIPIAGEVKRWLRAYSLSPELRMHLHPNRDSREKILREQTKLQAEIDEKLAALSPDEKIRRGRLVEAEGNLDALARLGFLLLADKGLEPFSEALTDWSFANAINSSYQVPTKEFIALIGLNRRDWKETRNALFTTCQDLIDKRASKVGKWALLRVLRATGTTEDDRMANVLYEELTKDREFPFGLVNAKNKLAPCDPAVNDPGNLDKKIDRYKHLDASSLRQHMGLTPQDHVFVDDRPILARFALTSAATKHCEFAEDVLKRTGLPLRQGLLELREHSTLVTEGQAFALVAKWNTARTTGDSQGLDGNERIMLQYELLIAFPFLDVSRQIDTLLATADSQPLLLDLINEVKRPDATTLDRFTKEAASCGSVYKQHLLLEVAAATCADITDEIRELAFASMASPEKRLRSSGLSLAARSGHADLLKAVAESEWASSSLGSGNDLESWYGSLAILKAAQAGLIDENAALDRISASLYGRAAVMLSDLAQEVARRLDASMRHVIGLPDELIAPDIELEAEDADPDEPVRFSISEREPPQSNIEDVLHQMSESNEKFHERQNRNYEAFIAFSDQLTAAKAHVVLDHLTQEEFSAIVDADPSFADRWFDILMNLNDSKLPVAHNFMLLLAGAIANTTPDKSEALFSRLFQAQSQPLVHFTFGKCGVDLDSMSAWAGGNAPALEVMRRRRLNNAATDQAIAIEVLSALQSGQESFLEDYVDHLLDRAEPADVARGLMITGFSDKSARNDQILEKYRDSAGLTGAAYSTAIAAYRSNGWARHWYNVLCETDDRGSYWQAGILFAQCVDGRFQLWKNEFKQNGDSIRSFRSCLNQPLKRRYEKIRADREKNLFGRDAPAPIFVHRTT